MRMDPSTTLNDELAYLAKRNPRVLPSHSCSAMVAWPDEGEPQWCDRRKIKAAGLCQKHYSKALDAFRREYGKAGVRQVATGRVPEDPPRGVLGLEAAVDRLAAVLRWIDANRVDLTIKAEIRRERDEVLTDARHELASCVRQYDRDWVGPGWAP